MEFWSKYRAFTNLRIPNNVGTHQCSQTSHTNCMNLYSSCTWSGGFLHRNMDSLPWDRSCWLFHRLDKLLLKKIILKELILPWIEIIFNQLYSCLIIIAVISSTPEWFIFLKNRFSSHILLNNLLGWSIASEEKQSNHNFGVSVLS